MGGTGSGPCCCGRPVRRWWGRARVFRWCFEFPAGQWCYTIQPQTPTYAEEGAIIGAVAGGAVGLIYGVLARRWTWRPVAVRDLTVQVAPAGGRLGVGIRWQP